jgi:hypothetical protein
MATTLNDVSARIFSTALITEGNKVLAPLQAFSLDLSREVVNAKGDTVEATVFGATTAAAFNKTSNNYGTAQGSTRSVPVVMSTHLKDSFAIDDAKALSSPVPYFTGAGKASAEALGAGILDTVFALLTVAKFSQESVLTLASIAKLNFAGLRKIATDAKINPRQAALVLSSDYFSALLALLDSNTYGGTEAIRTGVVPGLFGFSKVVEAPSLPTAENLIGYICRPEALAVAGRYLQPQAPGAYEEIGQMYDDVTGLTFGVRKLGNGLTGEVIQTVEALFGASECEPKSLVRLISAAR